MKVIGFLLRTAWLVLNLLAGGILLFANLGQFINPTTWVLPSLSGLIYEWLLLLNICFAIAWLFSHHKSRSLISLICLLCSIVPISHTIAHQSITQISGKHIYTHSLDILSYNTKRLDMFAKPSENRILQYIKESGADVVCLQEFETYKNSQYLTLQEVKEYLDYAYSYIDFKQYKGQRQYGLAVFSRYPLIHKQTLRYESTTNISDRCDIVIGNDTLRLLNNHLQSNRLTEKDLTILNNFADSNDDVKKSANKIKQKLTSAYTYRTQQADFIYKELEQSPYPVIMCGDFNDVPVSYVYRHISRHLNDAFLQSGNVGLGHTFHRKKFGLRIDYILHSRNIQSENFRVESVPYSDHYPIRCNICW
ncbi:MAG TPA: hypothetical protein DIW30_05055 [Bacteroidales bacterium]|nr:hypothetical protein [Bacteroidales bacterium]